MSITEIALIGLSIFGVVVALALIWVLFGRRKR
ncbi:MAG: hypothetical protein A4E32_00604 [Methanomassiliicoccales archaeon PtaU1.Bin124]|nr:MAG: hypothetical protein A4E32_00604 [Methanomassiliicoccales archaeon PtaU1.Bin124]